MNANMTLESLNAAQRAFDTFEGEQHEIAAVCQSLREARPQGYIAVHGNGFCHVCMSSGLLTNGAVSESEAVQIALENRVQTEIRFRLSTREWFI